MEDPEDDIDASEFECVQEAARDRTAPRTRRQYDLFIGLMKTFFVSQPDLKKEVVQDQCKMPLSITAVERCLTHVESKRIEYEPGKFKPVSPSYYRTVVRSVHDLYVCNQLGIEDRLRLLMYSRTKSFVRRIAEMKATGAYPPPEPFRVKGTSCYVHPLPRQHLQKMAGPGNLFHAYGRMWCFFGVCLHGVIE